MHFILFTTYLLSTLSAASAAATSLREERAYSSAFRERISSRSPVTTPCWSLCCRMLSSRAWARILSSCTTIHHFSNAVRIFLYTAETIDRVALQYAGNVTAMFMKLLLAKEDDMMQFMLGDLHTIQIMCRPVFNSVYWLASQRYTRTLSSSFAVFCRGATASTAPSCVGMHEVNVATAHRRRVEPPCSQSVSQPVSGAVISSQNHTVVQSSSQSVIHAMIPPQSRDVVQSVSQASSWSVSEAVKSSQSQSESQSVI